MDSPDDADGAAGRDADRDVPPLEHRAHFDIDVDEGYVHIEQSWGDRTLYTPDEARELAEEIASAAERAGGGGD